MDRQDRQDFGVCWERLLTAITVLIRYTNPVNPVYPCLNLAYDMHRRAVVAQ